MPAASHDKQWLAFMEAIAFWVLGVVNLHISYTHQTLMFGIVDTN